MFMRRVPFDAGHVAMAPRAPGVYILYFRESRKAAYVGRSRVDIRERLLRHLAQRGSRRIAEALRGNVPLDLEYQELGSAEQAEAQLITSLGTTDYFNLRRETDPADWE